MSVAKENDPGQKWEVVLCSEAQAAAPPQPTTKVRRSINSVSYGSALFDKSGANNYEDSEPSSFDDFKNLNKDFFDDE